MKRNIFVKTGLLVMLATLSLWTISAGAAPFCKESLLSERPLKVSQVFPGKISKKPIPIIISAPSGGGKTTLMKMLVDAFPKNFIFAVSTTTRAPRPGEVNGVDYNFVSVPEFQKMLAADAFVEHAQVHTNYYGTSKKNLEDALAAGRSPMLLVDVQGAEEIRKKLGGHVYSIFIVPPSMEVLEQRLRARATEAEAVIQKRLQNAAAEMDRQGEFDSVLVNDDLNVAYQNLILILQSIPR